jgi:transposase
MRIKNREELRKLAVELYSKLGDGHAVAKKLDLSSTTTYRLLNEAGIELSTLPEISARKKKLEGEKAMLVAKEYEEGTSMSKISKKYGVGQYAIYSAIKDAGIERRPRGQQPRKFKESDEKEIVSLYLNDDLTQEQIASKFNATQSTISKLLRKNGIRASGKSEGDRHGNWNGGKHLTGEGYIISWIPVDDDYASMRTAMGYVLEHRLVMARALGRPLTNTESVHHINGDKTDNDITNLQLRIGKHGKGETYRCADCGSYHVIAVSLKEDGVSYEA